MNIGDFIGSLFELFYDWVEKRWGKLAAWAVILAMFAMFVTSAFWVHDWLSR